MKLSKNIAVLLIFAILMLCIGCGGSSVPASDDDGGDPQESAASSKSDTANSLAFWAYEPQSIADKDAYQNLLEEFTAETGIVVKSSFVPKDSFNTKINSAIANGKGPDVSYLDQPRMAEFAQDGTLLDITDNISASSLKTENFFDSAMETNIYKEKYYGLPLNITTSVLLYNKGIVDETNLPTDWDSWIQICAGVTENPSKAAFEGIGTGGYSAWYFQAFVCNAGGSLVNSAQDAVTFNDSHGMDACVLLTSLYDYSPKEIRNSTSSFGNGNCAFTLGGGSDIDSLRKNFPTLEFGAMQMPPQQKGGTSYSNIGGENLVIYSASKKQDDAFKLIEFLSRKENSEKISQYTGNFSALKDLATTDDPLKQVVMDQLQTAMPRPQLVGWLTVNDSYLATALENILAGGDIEENLNTAAAQASALLFG